MIMVVIIVVGYHLFLISIGLLPDLHQTALICCFFPHTRPPLLHLCSNTFQPSLLIARYFLSPIRDTRPTHSLRRISYSFSFLLIDTLIHFARSAPPFAASCLLLP